MEEKSQQKQLLVNTLLAFTVSGAAAQPLGSFIPYLRQAYGFSYDAAGLFLSLLSLGNLIAVMGAGLLSLWVGRRRSILFTAVWMGFSYFIFATGFGAAALIPFCCFLMGVSRGGNSTFSNTMISTINEPLATKGYNLLHGAYAVGALLSPLLLILCSRIFPQNGWRIMAGLLLVLVVLQVMVYSRMRLPDVPSIAGNKKVDYTFVKDKKFWLSCTMLFFYIATEYSVVGWMVTYFQDIGLLNADYSQLMNSLFWLVILIGRILGAYIVGKVSKTKLLLIDGIGLVAFFTLMFFSRSTTLVTIGLMGTGLFMATIYPTAFSFGSTTIKGNIIGTSVIMFISSIGGIITPALVGLVAEKAGIRAGMGLVVAFTALLLVSIIISILAVKNDNLGQKGDS